MNSGVLKWARPGRGHEQVSIAEVGRGAGEVNHPVSAQLLEPGAQRQAVAHHDQALAVRAGLARECLFDGGCDSGAGFAFGLTAAAPYVVSGGPVGPLGGEAAFGLLGGETFPRSEVDLAQAGIQDQRYTQVGSDPGRGRGGSLEVTGDHERGICGRRAAQLVGDPAGDLHPLASPGGVQGGSAWPWYRPAAFQEVRPCRTAMRHPRPAISVHHPGILVVLELDQVAGWIA